MAPQGSSSQQRGRSSQAAETTAGFNVLGSSLLLEPICSPFSEISGLAPQEICLQRGQTADHRSPTTTAMGLKQTQAKF